MSISKLLFAALMMAALGPAAAQTSSEALDAKVEAFLKKHKGGWHDLNVPYEDGKVLHDIVVSHKYTSALEIGTSTGIRPFGWHGP